MSDRFKFRAGFKVYYYDEDGNDKELLINIDDCFSLDNGGEQITVHKSIIEEQLKDLSDYEKDRIETYIYSNFDEIDDYYLIDKLEYLDQCTGLKDRNGTLIYAGDIVKVPNDWEKYGFSSGTIREVFFNNGGFRLKPQFNKNSRGNWLEDTEDFEICGNIHENKELLK